MSDEATRRSSLSYKKGNVDWREHPTSFTFDVSGTAKGPVPGAVQATVAGVNIDLTELSTPGACRIMNLDDTNHVAYGIWDATDSIFFGLGELLPGEWVDLRLWRYLGQETGTGTGTIGSGNSLRLKADTAACECYVGAFEA